MKRKLTLSLLTLLLIPSLVLAVPSVKYLSGVSKSTADVTYLKVDGSNADAKVDLNNLDVNGGLAVTTATITNATITTATIENSTIGSLNAPDDGQQSVLIDQAITTALITNEVGSYVFSVDGTPVFHTQGLSNGLGTTNGVGVQFDGHRIIERTATGNSGTLTVGYGDDFIGINTTESVVVTLPSFLATIEGFQVTIKDEGYNAGSNNHTITGEAGELVNNATSESISSNGNSVSIYSDGSNWHVY